MTTYTELLAQREQLNQAIESAKAQETEDALNEIRAVMERARMTDEELLSHFAKKHRGNMGKVAPKYRSDAGDLWSGRGRKPAWAEQAIAQGRQLEEFAIPA